MSKAPSIIWAVFEPHEAGGPPRVHASATPTNGAEYHHASYVSTLEARLEKAREVIERQQSALKPMSDAVYNDNGDMTISEPWPVADQCVAAYWADRAARAWMEQNDE